MKWVVTLFRFPFQKVSAEVLLFITLPCCMLMYTVCARFFNVCCFSEWVDTSSGFLEGMGLHELLHSGPQTNWRSPETANGSGFVEPPAVPQSKSSERASPKQVTKTNGLREEHSHRGTGYISITGRWNVTPRLV